MTNTHKLTRSLTITTALLVLLVLFHLTELSTAVQRGVQTAVGTVQSVVVEQAQVTPAWSCWIEYKDDGTTEPISGDPALMPAGSDPVPCTAIEPTAEGSTPLADAAWDCFTALGYDTSGDVVYPSDDDLATCRAMAIGHRPGQRVDSGLTGCVGPELVAPGRRCPPDARTFLTPEGART